MASGVCERVSDGTMPVTKHQRHTARERAEVANDRARERCRLAIAAAMDAAPYTASAVGEHAGVSEDAALKWRKPGERQLPMSAVLWRMLTDDGVLGESGRRVLLEGLAAAGGFTVTWPDGVGFDADPAREQVCQMAAATGRVAEAVLAAGPTIDAAEARALLPKVRAAGAEVREFEMSLAEVAGG